MKSKILDDIERKLVSRFQIDDRDYSLYKLNEISYNLVDENEKKVRHRLKKFKSLDEIFKYLKIE